MGKVIIILIFWFLNFVNFVRAQEISNENKIDSLYSVLSEQITANNYLEILNIVNEMEPLLKEWTASVELIKLNALNELYDSDKPNSTYFINLKNSAQKIINSTENKKLENLPLYFEYYQRSFNILNRLNFIEKRNGWLTKPNYMQAAKLYVDKDFQGAFQQFSNIATENPAAMLMLGNMYEKGLGVTKNEQKAFELFKQALAEGNYDAGYHLGFLYATGLGVNKNFVFAFNYCLVAAENNYNPAIIQIIDMYKNGIGTEKNIDLVNLWKNKLPKSWNAYNY